MATPNLILTGFMGTGKSTVGHAVADVLGRPFVDLDDLLVERSGRDIPRIFAELGVVAFRQLEAAAVDEIAEQSGLVVATGGGTIVSSRNRRALARSGVLICLRAEPSEIEGRLHRPGGRPMLQGAPPHHDPQAGPAWTAELRRLLDGRAHAYSRVPHQLDTTGRSVSEVVAEVVELARHVAPQPEPTYESIRLDVRAPDGTYPIVFDPVETLGLLLREQGLTGRVAIVTNETVGRLYALPLQADLAVAAFDTVVLTVADGEQYKTLASAEALYTQLLEHGFDRSSTVVALGGGVIGDLAGFVAATYMRGLPFVQVPASLLAMVDASVGGKVAVDHPRAKNLIGAFKQPAAVLMDTDLLATLPEREWRCGFAEVVKHGLIDSPELFERLERCAAAFSAGLPAETTGRAGACTGRAIIRDAVAVKVRVVEEDPYERGRRAVLNLGHTFAHAFEILSEFEIAHGEAVAIGLVAACRLSALLGHAPPSLPQRVETLLDRLGLPTRFRHAPPEAVWEVMQRDKKKVGRQLRFVLAREVGDVFVSAAVPREAVLGILAELS
ncbi:MAG TPA: 3-dehydroquinate synthase [Ardenticatenaceae bacterium]|nr:3-dehydroquinate synthase [Ardenticatenaceae bacterium]